VKKDNDSNPSSSNDDNNNLSDADLNNMRPEDLGTGRENEPFSRGHGQNHVSETVPGPSHTAPGPDRLDPSNPFSHAPPSFGPSATLSVEESAAYVRALYLHLGCEVCLDQNKVCPLAKLHTTDAIYIRLAELAELLLQYVSLRATSIEGLLETKQVLEITIASIIDEITNLNNVLKVCK